MWQSKRASALVPIVIFGLVQVSCAYHLPGAGNSTSTYARALSIEASAITAITCEEDFLDARMVYQGLPEGIPEKQRLREALLSYLLGKQAALDATTIRKKPGFLGTEENIQTLEDSFGEALDLFSPRQKYATAGPALSERERALLLGAARLQVAIFSPRGNEQPVVTALAVLATLDSGNPDWKNRITQVFAWIESSAQVNFNQFTGRRAPGVAEMLLEVGNAWPSPAILERIANQAVARQDKVAGMFRRPIGTGDNARNLLGEFLLDTDSINTAALSAVGLFLRCGALEAARDLAQRFADKPSDDVELRQLLVTSAAPGAKLADLLALARRFLPKSEPLGGTSQDYLDPRAAMTILAVAMDRFPHSIDALLLSARVARLLPAPLLSLRYIEETSAQLARTNSKPDLQAELAAERMELAFIRLKMRMDPDRLPAAEKAANTLRAEFSELHKRHRDAKLRLDEADIDYLLASGFMDAGQGDRADPLLERARKSSELDASKQLATLLIKRGETTKAIALLGETIAQREANSMARDTIGFVEGQARLFALLGNAHDIAGDAANARKAWGQSARFWERLMMEFLRRKNLAASAEATFEVGRNYYLLGRPEEGIRKLFEAIEQDDDRDQSYLDGIAFLVQRGETEAALDIYRRALSRPGRGLSEYVKVYASLWILDLTRREGGSPDAGAISYLRAIASRQVALRPPRTMVWYTQLARYAIRQISFDTLLSHADSNGKRAEAYFYEAMHQLELNSTTSAHALWTKVLETKMVSFFEYEMASRYLRCGAPTRPNKIGEEAQTI